MSAKVPFTCPDINAAQKLVADLVGLAEGEVESRTLRLMRRDAGQVTAMLEELRESNDKLRAYGERYEAAADEAESQLAAVTEELDDSKKEHEQTEIERNRLEVLVTNLAAVLRLPATDTQKIGTLRRLLKAAGHGPSSEPIEMIPEVKPAGMLPAHRGDCDHE